MQSVHADHEGILKGLLKETSSEEMNEVALEIEKIKNSNVDYCNEAKIRASQLIDEYRNDLKKELGKEPSNNEIHERLANDNQFKKIILDVFTEALSNTRSLIYEQRNTVKLDVNKVNQEEIADSIFEVLAYLPYLSPNLKRDSNNEDDKSFGLAFFHETKNLKP